MGEAGRSRVLTKDAYGVLAGDMTIVVDCLVEYLSFGP